MNKNTRRILGRKIGLFFLRLFVSITGSVPLRLNYFIGYFLGSIFYLVVPHYRKVASQSLNVAFPYKTIKERKNIAKSSIKLMVCSVIETIYFLKNQYRLNNVRIEGRQYLEEALKQNKGVIGFTAHFGNFPLMDLKLAKENYPVSVILRPIRDPRTGEHIYDMCVQGGVKTILSYPREEVVSKTIKALRNNELVIVQMDQNFGTGGVWVDFFGKLAATPVGPIVFALRTKAVILPIYIIREGMGKHCIKILEPYNLEKASDTRETVLLNAAKITKIIEGWIKENPEQWFWIHSRWKSRPSDIVKKAKFKIYSKALAQ
ncbi:MAG: lysophospholipid acyltransferase family protein [Candidatus Omnitrophica bacterium]|nr:lysophospholipid acyltransferase family protein [Candidatus Omnitrophota bacterium]MDD5351699.1 lysophospholipid acyltransferase family protein [Candidatus Omnitrophota bacterium]MDD5550909.1 lysophospholipid acyltransferase family protein [Candidatus Omnitrophota bacterium]